MSKEKKTTFIQIIIGSILSLSSFVVILLSYNQDYLLLNKYVLLFIYVILIISFLYLLFVIIFNVVLGKYNYKLADALSYINIISLSMLIVLIISTFFFYSVTVVGSSMEPTLQNDDQLIISKTSSIDNNDIVIIDIDGEDNLLIKRIVASGGDKITTTSDGKIYVNDELICETSIIPNVIYTDKILAEGEFYFLGDNRTNSKDGRYFGIINRENIVGEAIFSLTTFKKVK